MIVNLAEYKKLKLTEEAANELPFLASLTKDRDDLSDFDIELLCLTYKLGYSVAEILEGVK